ncbi:MAG: type II secretion system protein GspD, partial [Frankiaceae bacterium]|nr:type II secretion system protein GspD [Arenimonas sp.]
MTQHMKNAAMTFPIRFSLLAPICLATALAGCVTPTAPRMSRNPEALNVVPAQVAGNGAVGQAGDKAPSRSSQPTITRGNGQVINTRAANQPPPRIGSGGEEATFNFEGESLHAVVKAILGDLLQQNYVIAPNVQGTVTLATPKPVGGAQALSILEMVLGWNNARLVWSDGRYNILPNDQAVPGNLSPRTGSPANARGYETRIVPLKYISATEMEKLLKPYARPNAV